MTYIRHDIFVVSNDDLDIFRRDVKIRLDDQWRSGPFSVVFDPTRKDGKGALVYNLFTYKIWEESNDWES